MKRAILLPLWFVCRMEIESLLDLADQRMYSVKREGCNWRQKHVR